MKNLYVLTFILLIGMIISAKADVVPEGNVSGNWTVANQPYYVEGNITVPDGQTLTIQSGVEVRFRGNYIFTVQGRLLANGTLSDSIYFVRDLPTHENWGGIKFLNNIVDVSTLSYCVIEDGLADARRPDSSGGAIRIINNSPVISHCRIENNTAYLWGGAVYIGGSSNPTFEYCTIQNNSAHFYGGAIAADGAPFIARNNTFYNNHGRRGGAFYLYGIASGTVTIENNIIDHNTADPEYGGGIFSQGSVATINIEKNQVINNSGIFGGGIYSHNSTSLLIRTNIIRDNQATGGYGGGIGINGLTSGTITNNTIYNNSAAYGGGIGTLPTSSATVSNSVLWANTASISGPEIYLHTDADVDVQYSDIQGGYTGTGSNNIDSNPLFTDPANHDFHFQANSPLVDAGTNTGVAATDFDENPIPFDGDRNGTATADIGVFEYQNTVPEITSTPGTSTLEDQLYSYQMVVNDPDVGESITYSKLQGPAALTVNSSTGLVQWTPANADTGDHIIELQVADRNNATDTQQYTLNVVNVNDAPVVSGIPDQTIPEGGAFTTISLDNYVSDVDNTDLQMTWNYSGNVDLIVNYNPVSRVISISTPNSNWNGSETITFIASDPGELSDSDEAVFTVTPINDPPVITGQVPLSTPEETALTITLNDLTVTDPDNTYPIGFTLSVQNGTNYTRSGNTITPATNYNGNLTVPVTVNDGQANSNVYNLVVSVTAVNDPPVITGQTTLTTPEETALTITLANLTVTDPDNSYPTGFTLSVQNGTNYTRSGNTITPVTNFTGNLTVPVTVNDGAATSNVFNLTVSVTNINDPPVITGQVPLSTPEETALTITLANLTVTDPDNSYPTGFTLSVQDGANYTRTGNTITPAANFNGNLSVPVTVNDGAANSNVYNLTVSVTAVNDPPVITGQVALSTPEETALTITLANLTVTDPDNTYPTGFTLSVQNGTNYTRSGNTITPATNYNGNLTVPVTVNDGAATSNVYNLTVSVTAVNDPPVITGQVALSTPEETALTITLANLTVTDPDNTYPTGFTLSVQNGTNYTRSGNTITPATNYNGNLTVPVTVNDGAATSNVYNLTVSVTAINDPPVITGQVALSTPEETALTITLANLTVTDPDNNYPTGFTLSVQNGTNYTRSGNTITPATNFNGNLTVPVTVNDGAATSNVYNLTVSVTAVNDPPVITGQVPLSTQEETALTITLNDLTVTDPDNSYPTGFTLSVQNGTNYTRTGNTITPVANFTGNLTVPVTVNDGQATSGVYNLTVSVTNLNDPPVITGQTTLSTPEETALTITLANLTVTDPDNSYPADFTLSVQNGTNYTRNGNTITPVTNFNGNLSVPVTVNDGQANSNVYNLTVTVTAVNDPPVITGQVPLSTPEETALTITLANLTVTDPDNTYPTGFTLSVQNGTYYTRSGNTITPVTNFTGNLTVPVTVNDGTVNSNVYNLTVSVTNINDPPVITGQEPLITMEETALTITLSDLTVTDPDNTYPDDFTLSVQDGANYTRSGNTITPVTDFTGELTVPVTVNDGAANSNVYNLAVSVVEYNDPPVITGQTSLSTPEETALTITLSDLTVTDPDNTYPDDFTLSVQDGTNYTRDGNTITPVTDFNGNLTVPVTVNDGISNSNIYDLTVSVTPINDPPEITGQTTLSTPEETALTITLSDLTVTDPDNTYPNDFTLTVQDGINYTHVDNTITPEPDYNGDITVPVIVNDGSANSNEFDLLVTVISVNDAPAFINPPDSLLFNEDDSLVFQISELYDWVEDPDHPDSSLQFQASGSQFLTVTVDSPRVVLRAAANWFGKDTVYFFVSDGELLDTAQVAIEVKSVNDVPYFTGVPDSVEFINTANLVLNLNDWVRDNDLPDDSLRWEFSVSDTNLHYQFNSSASELTLTAPDFIGKVSLYFSVTDDSAAMAFDTLLVKVNLDPTGIEPLMTEIPTQYVLSQNYPNPFNPVTKIKYGLPKAGNVTIEIYNILGQKVETILNEFKPAGYHLLNFDGNRLSSGIYFYRIQINEFDQIKKMMLIK